MVTQLSTPDALQACDHWSNAVESRIAHVKQFCSSRVANETAADPIQVMDHELVAMLSAVNLLHTRRNAMLPVSTLPQDVLSLIFSLLSGQEKPKVIEHPHDSEISLGWIKITHVCRFWRQVALQHARLWSDNVVSLLGPCWLEEMTNRSGSAPISLEYEQLSYRDCELLSRCLSRVQRLQLIDPEPDLWSAPQSCVFPADMLDTLCISTSQTNPPYDFVHFLVPNYLFANAPRLHRLILDGYMLPRLPLFCANLTHLEISGNGRCIQDRAWFLESLRGMTTLEVLILVDCLPPPVAPATAQQDDSNHVLPMPHLVNLTLTGSPRRCASVMRCLDIPASAELKLCLSLSDEKLVKSNFHDILSCVQAHAQASSRVKPLHTLHVNHLEYADHCQFLRVWNQDLPDQFDSFEYIAENISPRITIVFPFAGSSLTGTVLLPEFIKAFVTPELRFMCVETMYHGIPSKAWTGILMGAAQLEWARICGTSVIGFCEAFASPGPVNSNSRFPVPILGLLELRNAHFGLSASDNDRRLSDLLPQWLARRRSRTVLLLLVIAGCHIEEECVDKLRELADVCWDGNCGEYDSDSDGSSDEDGSDSDGSYSEEDPEIAQLVLDVLEGRPVPDT